MKILGKGNNQYCLFVYQYYLLEFNELFSNPCKNSKESLNTTQFGEYLNNWFFNCVVVTLIWHPIPRTVGLKKL